MADQPVAGRAFDLNILKRIFRFTKPYRKGFYLSVGLTLLLAVLGPLRPMLVQYTVDTYISRFDGQGLLYMSLILVGLLLAQSAVQYFHTYLTNWIGQAVIRDLRIELFRHILRLRLKFFDRTPIGTLVTRSISDMETIADIFSEGLIVIIGDLLQLVVIVVFMFAIDWKLSLISLSTIPILLFATRFFQKGIRDSFRDVRTQVAALNSFVQEHLTGMSIVQVFNREDEELRRFKQINREHRSANIRSVWYYSIFFPVVEILTAASIGLLVWWGARGVIQETASVGNVIAFIMYINMIFRPIRELADKFNTLQMGVVSSERVFRLLDQQEFISDKGTGSADHIRGSIEFRNVWFSYKDPAPDADPAEPDWILRDLDLNIEAGKMIALVGATGAGKSSVINLIGRQYEFQRGEIRIDGSDVRSFSLDSLRRNIAMVTQDVQLFRASIRENLTFFDRSIPDEKIIATLEDLELGDWFRTLPKGLDSELETGSKSLSAGEAQLLAFTRVFLRNPGLVILDEASSRLDPATEQKLEHAITKLLKGRTAIIIAHRLDTLHRADEVLILEKGVASEYGDRKQLASDPSSRFYQLLKTGAEEVLA